MVREAAYSDACTSELCYCMRISSYCRLWCCKARLDSGHGERIRYWSMPTFAWHADGNRVTECRCADTITTCCNAMGIGISWQQCMFGNQQMLLDLWHWCCSRSCAIWLFVAVPPQAVQSWEIVHAAGCCWFNSWWFGSRAYDSISQADSTSCSVVHNRVYYMLWMWCVILLCVLCCCICWCTGRTRHMLLVMLSALWREVELQQRWLGMVFKLQSTREGLLVICAVVHHCVLWCH